MDLTIAYDKPYQKKRLTELVNAPVFALRGVSKKDAEMLNEAFHVKTVRDLATLKFALWAREICELADSKAKVSREPFKNQLIKKFEKKSPALLAKSPVHALQGLSEHDAELLDRAFHVKTIRDLAELKYIAWAQQTVDEALMSDSMKGARLMWKSVLKYGSIAALACILVIILLLAWPGLRQLITGTGPGAESDIAKIPPYGPPSITEPRPDADKASQAPGTASTAQRDKTPVATATPVPVKEEGANGWFYTVQRGDTLASISKKLYGNHGKTQVLYEGNRESIRDANVIFPGMKLRLPEKTGATKGN
jgi:nucleoid-associated protein YgaU